MPEEDAKALSSQGAKALKEEACRRTQWHDPIPQILAATLESQVLAIPFMTENYSIKNCWKRTHK
jgi:hypothetical protein